MVNHRCKNNLRLVIIRVVSRQDLRHPWTANELEFHLQVAGEDVEAHPSPLKRELQRRRPASSQARADEWIDD